MAPLPQIPQERETTEYKSCFNVSLEKCGNGLNDEKTQKFAKFSKKPYESQLQLQLQSPTYFMTPFLLQKICKREKRAVQIYVRLYGTSGLLECYVSCTSNLAGEGRVQLKSSADRHAEKFIVHLFSCRKLFNVVMSFIEYEVLTHPPSLYPDLS